MERRAIKTIAFTLFAFKVDGDNWMEVVFIISLVFLCDCIYRVRLNPARHYLPKVYNWFTGATISISNINRKRWFNALSFTVELLNYGILYNIQKGISALTTPNKTIIGVRYICRINTIHEGGRALFAWKAQQTLHQPIGQFMRDFQNYETINFNDQK